MTYSMKDLISFELHLHYCRDGALFARAYARDGHEDKYAFEAWMGISINSLHKAADAIGYDLVKRQPAPSPEPLPAIDPVLTATADAGLMSAGDYVKAVTSAPGFDGRDQSIGMKVSDIADPEERS